MTYKILGEFHEDLEVAKRDDTCVFTIKSDNEDSSCTIDRYELYELIGALNRIKKQIEEQYGYKLHNEGF